MSKKELMSAMQGILHNMSPPISTLPPLNTLDFSPSYPALTSSFGSGLFMNSMLPQLPLQQPFLPQFNLVQQPLIPFASHGMVDFDVPKKSFPNKKRARNDENVNTSNAQTNLPTITPTKQKLEHENSNLSNISSERNNVAKKISPQKKRKAYVCSYKGCNKVFSWKWSMETHARTHLGPEGRIFKCKYCKKGFFTSGCLKSHTKIHTRTPLSYCCKAENCNKRYSTSEGLRLHIRNHHEGKHKKWVCTAENCTRSFVRQADLRLHTIRIHSAVRPFPCPLAGCNKSFACLSELRRHRGVHENRKKKLQKIKHTSNTAENTFAETKK